MFGSTTTSTASNTWVVRLSSQALAGVSTLADATRLIDPAGNGLQILSGLGLPGLMLVQGTGAASNLQSYLAGNRALAYFQADQKVTTNAVFPNDPDFGRLYGLNNVSQTGGMFDADIDAPEAWDISTGSRNTVVSVIDTGVDLAHRDLYQNIWINQGEIPQEIRSRLNDSDRDGRFTFIDLNAPTNASFVVDGNRNGYIDALDLLADTRWATGTDNEGNGFVDDLFGWDFVNNDNNPMDDQSHGTHVAGTIGASGGNGVGVVGVNWQVSIMPLKFLSATGGGSTADAIRAVNYATMMRSRYDPGVRVSSNSWGGGGYSQALLDSIDAGGAAGVLFVAAAGNSAANSDTTPAYPAAYASSAILSVASTDSSDRLSSFSNYGATSVDVGAPGSSIYSTVPGGYGTKSGTSMATPQVSGAAALALAVNPGLSVAQLKYAILRTADPVASLAGKTMSGGRVNAFRLLQAVGPVAPSLVLSSTSIRENSAVGTEVGVLTVSTATGGTASVYSLVGGAGGADNSAFVVRENRLLTNARFDFEAKSTFSIRLRAVAGGVAVEQSFTIQVTNVNEAPTGVLLSNVVQSIPQSASTASRTKVADIGVQDDALGRNTLALTGNDASSFEIVGSAVFLRAGVVLDRMSKPTYSVRVVAFDATVPGSMPASIAYTLTVTAPTSAGTTLVFQGQDFQFRGGSANYIWQAGDYWRQSFTVPSVATVTQLALQLQVTSNSTSRAGLDMGVFVNSIRVGQFSLTVGTSGTQNYSYSFAAIAGPTFQIELRALNTVPAGQGAVSLVTASGNSFARIGSNAVVGQTSVATLSRIPGEGYARLVQSGIALQQGQTYRFTMRMAGSVQLGGTDHMPEFWGEGLIFDAFGKTSYERDGWTYYQATVTPQKTGIYELKLALWSRQSLNVTDISLKSLSTGAESVRNGSFVDGLSGWYSHGGRIGRAVH